MRQQPLRPRYRSAQAQLLQAVPQRELANRLPGGEPYFWDRYGPTHHFVDASCGWPWSRPGGDWLDAAGQRHGPTPWFSVPVDQPPGPEGPRHHFADVSRLVQRVQTEGRWLALLLRVRNSARHIGGATAGSPGAPAIDVVYADGSRARLRCRVGGHISHSTVLAATALAALPLPACLEFERPQHPVQSATLRFVVLDHWAGAQPAIEGFLLDPPLASEAPRSGLAAQGGALDAGLDARPEVIGQQRYLDGRSLADFVHAEGVNFSVERAFDPAVLGLGPADTRRLPHAGLGKWHNAGPPMALVPSHYQGDGFAPLAPGLGALRLQMPATAGLGHGSVVGHEGSLAGHARIFMPEPLFGRLERIFVRYYLRLGLPAPATRPPRLQVQHRPGQPVWTDLSGKFGIGPDHSTHYGGVSGSSGGSAGWQMRLGWHECDAGLAGPDEGGWAPGFHLYDFLDNNPPGHRYGREQAPQFERWGQRGGQGGMLYAGHWYCIETELKLNTLLNTGPGYLPDGELRAWLDGRLVYERSGLVFRAGPLGRRPDAQGRLQACRELGVSSLWLNWFHGGQTANTVDRTLFYTGLVWARRYIGPMVL